MVTNPKDQTHADKDNGHGILFKDFSVFTFNQCLSTPLLFLFSCTALRPRVALICVFCCDILR
jgi:hypothetical protein